jgi:sugar lactone lactonase YvrE
VIPGGDATIDSPAAMMVNGKILCLTSPLGTAGPPVVFYEYDYLANAFTLVSKPGNITNLDVEGCFMLDLPDGSILFSGNALYTYTPDGDALSLGKPGIVSITTNYYRSYHLVGTGLNGITEGAAFGDDAQMNSNYPLVRMTNNSNGNVYYARTYNWSSTGVMTGTNLVSTDFLVPANLPAASYSLVVVANGNNSAATNFIFTPDPLSINPLSGFASIGPSGGPFYPMQQSYELSNLDPPPLPWSLGNTSVWLQVSQASGLLASGGHTAIVASIVPSATNWPLGTYTTTIWFTNLNSGAIQSIPFQLEIDPLLRNGGFEFGSFAYWELLDDMNYTVFQGNLSAPRTSHIESNYDTAGGILGSAHSGQYSAFLGMNTTTEHLSQTVPTVPGQSYLLSFFLNEAVARAASNEFAVSWGGTTLFDQHNSAYYGYTNLQFILWAANTSTTLTFSFQNSSNYFIVDDISLSNLPALFSIVSQPVSQVILAGGSASFSVLANGPPPFTYQWQKNGGNLVDGGDISGSMTANLSVSRAMISDGGNYMVVVGNRSQSITSLAADLVVIGTNTPGFTVRVSQIDYAGADASAVMNSVANMETALGPVTTNGTDAGLPSAGLFVDPHTGLYCANAANLSEADTNGYFFVPGYINMDIGGSSAQNGDFTSNDGVGGWPKSPFPGIPGFSQSNPNTSEFAVAFTAYVHLQAGQTEFGVDSDDGFLLTLSAVANPNDAFSRVTVGEFNGLRGWADSLIKVSVPTNGSYALRLDYEQGGGAANCELFTVIDGVRILVNETNNSTCTLAYATPEVYAEPYAVLVSPMPGQSDAIIGSKITVVLQDGVPATVNTNSIVLKLNGVAVAPAISQTPSFLPNGQPLANLTTIAFPLTEIPPLALTNTAELSFADANGNPTDHVWSFTITNEPPLSAVAANPTVNLSATNSGFIVYPRHTPAGEPNDVAVWTEEQILGLMGTNYATLTAWPNSQNGQTENTVLGPQGWYFVYTNYINWEIQGATSGNGDFTSPDGLTGYPKQEFPGIIIGNYHNERGFPTTDVSNFAMLVETWLDFPTAGTWMMGVNSDDGFSVKSGQAPGDIVGQLLGEFEGLRGAADTTFSFFVPQEGLYPFRLLYEQGFGEANCEWFTVTPSGQRVLINDSSQGTNAIYGYMTAAKSPIYVSGVIPVNGATGVPPDANISAFVVDGNPAQVASVQMWINGAPAIVTATRSNNVTTATAVNMGSPYLLLPGTNNTATIVYSDTASPPHTYTNSWQFTVPAFSIQNTVIAVSNLGQPFSFYTGPGKQTSPGPYNFSVAASFHVGSASVALESIIFAELSTYGGAATGFSVALYAGMGASGPEGLITVLSRSTAPSGVNVVYIPQSPTSLLAEKTYWLVMASSTTPNDTGFDIAATGSTNNDAGALPGWSIGDTRYVSSDGGVSWFQAPGIPQFAVESVVDSRLSIAAQPENRAVGLGGTAQFSVIAAGTAPLAYQWLFDGTNLAGAIGPQLSIASVGAGDAGLYQVVVTNYFGSVTSVVATLSLAYPPTIINEPATQTNLAGANVTLSVAVSGTGPFTYQWQFNGTNLSNGIITTVAGGGTRFPGDGGAATKASLNDPSGVAFDAFGNLFIADAANNRVRKVDTNGIITTVAGNGNVTTNQYGTVIGTYYGDEGAATNAGLYSPCGVVFDSSGNLFIVDIGNQRIRGLDTNGTITTVAGNGTNGYSGDGGKATNASLSAPGGVAFDASGNLLIADQYSNRVRKVNLNGVITTVAGNGLGAGTGFGGYSGDGGVATNASLNLPCGVATDAFGNIFIADNGNNRIRKVNTNGLITTVAGNGAEGYGGDGGAATQARLKFPSAVASDVSGNLFIADVGNYRIRKVDLNGIITTIAGNGSPGYSGDGGVATNASLNYPGGIAVDDSSNLYIADGANDRLREVDFGGLPSLNINNVSTGNSGAYQVIVTSPYGSVTSAVATLTIINPTNQAASIVMNPPVISGTNLLLGFSLSQGTNTSFTLLQTPSLTGPWTTNTAAVLTTNAQAGGFQYSIPTPGSVEFFQVRSP